MTLAKQHVIGVIMLLYVLFAPLSTTAYSYNTTYSGSDILRQAYQYATWHPISNEQTQYAVQFCFEMSNGTYVARTGSFGMSCGQTAVVWDGTYQRWQRDTNECQASSITCQYTDPTKEYLNITLKDVVTGNRLNQFTVIIQNSSFSRIVNTTNGAATIWTNETPSLGVYNITAYSIEGGTFFNVTRVAYNWSTFGSLQLETAQAMIRVTAQQLYTNASISTFNASINQFRNSTVNYTVLMAASNGSNMLQVDVPGNYSKNYTLIVTTPLQTLDFTATGIYDNVLSVVGNGTPVISSLNCTSCNPPIGDNSSPYYTSDTTPTFKFHTNINANCRIGSQNLNHTAMGSSRDCMAGEGLTRHTCTLTSQDALPPEAGTVYIACKNTADGSESANSSSGALQIIGIARNEGEAIDYGIHQSVVWPQATVYENQQVYLRDVNNRQLLATVDRVVVYGNQRWIINHDNTTAAGLFNLSPAVYSLDLKNMTLLEIESAVTAFINATKN